MRPRRHPVLVTFLLALHIIVLGTAPVADAIAEAQGARAFVHIEAPGTNKCPPVHNDLNCQFCRAAGHTFFGGVSVLPLFASAGVRLQPSPRSDNAIHALDGVAPFAARPPPSV
jgi:hypothetical protein